MMMTVEGFWLQSSWRYQEAKLLLVLLALALVKQRVYWHTAAGNRRSCALNNSYPHTAPLGCRYVLEQGLAG